MAHIDVTRSHHLGLDGARRAAEEVAHELQHHHRIGLRTHWEGDTLVAHGTGFKGRIEARPDAVRVAAELGLLLRPLRGRIEHEVERYLDQYVGQGG